MFGIGQANRYLIDACGTQPNRQVARLMPVIAPLTFHPGRRLALELLLRAAAIALAAIVILGLLPAIAEAFG